MKKWYSLTVVFKNSQGIVFEKTKGTTDKEKAERDYKRALNKFPYDKYKLISLVLNEGFITPSN